jgi:peptide/nickel transport system substrate-binding protein
VVDTRVTTLVSRVRAPDEMVRRHPELTADPSATSPKRQEERRWERHTASTGTLAGRRGENNASHTAPTPGIPMDRTPLPLFVALFALLAACGGADGGSQSAFEDAPPEERYGGTAVIGSISDIPDMNPLTSTETLASEMQQHVLFLPVIQYDENLQPQPAFARSWETNEDTTALTFHLRDDIYWHDGVKTTAYDLAFAYEMANEPATAFPNAAFWDHYGRGEAVDSFTFRVEMEPHAEFLDPWRTFPAVPVHILGDVEPAQMAQHRYSREPLGNGPFRFVSRVDGQSWTFDANPDFPEDLGGRPYLDRLVYRSIPEETTLLTELLTGRVHFFIAVSPDQTQAIEENPSTRLITYPDRSFILIGWNQRREPFDDVRVRRALTMAMNREGIVEAALYGYGSRANSTVPPFFWQYNEKAGGDLGYDPEAALALLQEAGYARGPDGMLRNAAGEQLSFTLNTNQGRQVRADIAEIIQADLRSIGIEMNIQILEWGTLLDRINDPRQRDFDAVLIGWRTEFRLDDTDLFHCNRRDQPFQWVGHCDQSLDALLDTLPTLADREQALPLWMEYQQLVSSQQPYTFVYFEERLQGVHNQLRNVHPDPRGDLLGVAQWYLSSGQQAMPDEGELE